MIFSFPNVNEEAKRFEFNKVKMGGDFRIIVYEKEEEKVLAPIEKAYQLVDSLVEIFSSYSNDSYLSKLNTYKTLTAPPADLVKLMARSQEAFENSNGYFDISIQPVIDIWNQAAKTSRLPTKRKLKRIGTSIGFSNAVLRLDSLSLEISKSSKVNLGGIAKGYIIDKVYQHLYNLGFNNFLIEAAGDIRVFGAPPEKPYWEISVSSDDNSKFNVKLLSGQAIATSGSTYRFRCIEGRKYSHIVNPKTLTPVTHNNTSTVIANDATTADYLASALNIVRDSKTINTIIKKEENSEFIIFSNNGIILKSKLFPFIEQSLN
ncbi:FAD:protein FMN transferase [Flavivirga eckloniae]|nr:FAD:protein FMN transferase [Flavivirga eckloniae]